MAGSISTRILLSGGKEFADQFKTIASKIKEASTSMEVLNKTMKQEGVTADSLRSKIDGLVKEYNLHQNAIDLVENRMREMAATGKLTEQQQAEFTAEINRHKSAQRDLAAELSNTRTELDNYGREADEAEKETKELGNAADDASANIGTGLATAVAVATVALNEAVQLAKAMGRKLIEVGKESIKYNASIETAQKTIEAFFRTSGQGYDEATANAQSLISAQKDLSRQIGIGTDVLIDANRMLIAAGINGNRSQEAITALSKAIVATGGGNDELARMAQNLVQIQNVGKASATDIKQFGMAGVDVYSLLSESTGKTVAQLKKMDITFDMIVDALALATAEGGKFFEASQVGATTLEGKMNILKSTIQEDLGGAFQPINDVLRDKIIPAATEFVENIDWALVTENVTILANGLGNIADEILRLQEWYNTTFGPPAVETIDAFTASNEDLKNSFYATGGAINLVDTEMAGAVEAVKGHGNHMVMEFDGIQQSVTKSVQETAGEVKNELIDMGWEMLQQGETDARQLGEGIANGSISAETETKTLMDNILKEVDKRSQAEQYGADFVSGFATGMHRNNGLVANAAASIAQTIKSLLHFSRPDEGPLRDYEEWMPHMMQGLAQGIDENLWRVQQAASNIAGTIAQSTNVTNLGGVTFNITQNPGENGAMLARRINRQLGEVY